MLPFDPGQGWRSETAGDSTSYVRDVSPRWRLCVIFHGDTFQLSMLADPDGAQPIQDRTATLTPEQAMQNADNWWSAASRLHHIHDAEPLTRPEPKETPHAS